MFCVRPARLQIDEGNAVHVPAMALAWSANAAHQRWRVLAESDEGGDGANDTPAQALWLSFHPLGA